MPATEERMQILKMIENGQISAAEGARLLEAIQAARVRPPTPPGPPGPNAGGKWFRVRVTDMRSGRQKVNVNIPMGLMNIGAKIGARFTAPLDIDLDELVAAIKAGATGKIIDVQDDEDGERVEIFVE